MNKPTAAPGVKKDHPGVYIPPPMLYVFVFLFAFWLQKNYPINAAFFNLSVSRILGMFFIIITLVFLITSIRQFIVSKNTLVPIKPATSLETNGVYGHTRNPMYVGLLTLYLAITFMIGNWWNFILLPLLILIIQTFVIKKEEKYLERRFGSQYTEYKRKVRRWI